MKYIYDILLNFNDSRIYDFYEWHTDDDIEYFKKVPLIRIDETSYSKIAIGAIIDDKSLLDNLYNTTEVYDNKRIRRVEYVTIIANGSQAIGVLLNKTGKIIMLSKMLLDEEEEAIEICNDIIERKINIKTFDIIRTSQEQYLTRNESKKLFFLNKEISSLYMEKNLVKLKYLYYECSHQIEDDIDTIFQQLRLFLNMEWSMVHNELYDLVRLSYSKK